MRERYRAIGRLVSAACLIAGCQRLPEPKPLPSPVPKTAEIPELEQERYWNEFTASYQDWKNKYVESVNGQLKVIQPENDGITTSEGIAYGMIMAVNCGDKETFDKLWDFAKDHFNQNGLMSWQIKQDGRIIDTNSATDADMDMVYALIVADSLWGGYKDQASDMLGKIMTHDVEKETFVLKPGDSWGGSQVTNPSYFSPAYYQLFKQFTGDQRWDRVAQKSRDILDKINAKHCLYPDWCTAEGDPVSGQDYGYFYNAVRVSWRQGMAAEFFGDLHAQAQLQKINAFFQGKPVPEIVDGYDFQGTVIGKNHNAAFVCAFALASKSQEAIEELEKLRNENYYSDSLRLLTLLLLSNRMLH
jgi:endo-1,4-beta-D-glucanase Y